MATANYAIYGLDEHMESLPFGEVHSQFHAINNKPLVTVPRVSQLDAISVDQKLKQYESYLDDYSRFYRSKLRWIAMRKFSHIMQSIKSKSRDRFQFEYHEEGDHDDDDDDEDDVDDYDDGARDGTLTNGRLVDNTSDSRSTSFRPIMGSLNNQRKQNYPDWNKIIRKHRSRVRSNQYDSHHAFTWGTIAPSNIGQ